jgi:MFS family permease
MRHVAPRSPLRELLTTQAPSVIVGAGVAATIAGFNGMLYGFVPAWLVQSLHYAPAEAALAMTVALIASSAGLIVSGWLGDRLPGRLILRVGTALLIVAVYPIYALLVAHAASPALLLAALSLVFSIPSGIWPSVLAALFPTRVRFTGIAFSYNISVTLLSGFAPLSATVLIEHTGNLAAPAVYIAACTALSLVASFFVRGRVLAVRDAGEFVAVSAAVPLAGTVTQ